MISSERQIYILKKLEEKGVVYLKETSEELGASICTIRRDFEKLEKENKCKRVHGGAVFTRKYNRLHDSCDIHMNSRMDMTPETKRLLCKKCATLIEENDCVFIDGGTTFMYMCEYLEGKKVTIVTHSDFIRASDDSSYSVFVLGGENSPFYRMNLGPMTLKVLSSFHFDKAFIGCAGMSVEDLNLYTAEVGTAQIKEMAIKNANRKYMVMDHTKIGIYGFYNFCNLNEMEALITDKSLENIETNAEIILAKE